MVKRQFFAVVTYYFYIVIIITMKITHTYYIQYEALGLHTYVNADDWYSYDLKLKFVEYTHEIFFIAKNEQTGETREKKAKTITEENLKKYIREFCKNKNNFNYFK